MRCHTTCDKKTPACFNILFGTFAVSWTNPLQTLGLPTRAEIAEQKRKAQPGFLGTIPRTPEGQQNSPEDWNVGALNEQNLHPLMFSCLAPRQRVVEPAKSRS